MGLIFLLSTGYFFYGIFFGIDFTDSFFHLNQARDPANGVYLLPFFLSTFILKWITSLVGYKLIIFRIAHAFCLIFTTFIPFVIIRPQIRTSKILLASALIIILFAPLNFNILSYDSFSILAISLIFSATVVLQQKRSFYWLTALAVFTAGAVLLRLPNLFFIPFLVFYVYRKNKKADFQKTVYFLLTTCFIIAASYLLYYHDLAMFENSSVEFSLTGFKVMVVRYFKDAVILSGFTVFLIFLYYLFRRLKIRNNKVLPYVLTVGSLFIFMVLFVPNSDYSKNYSFFLTSICLSYVAIGFSQNTRSGNYSVLLLFLIFILLYPIGSNTGLLKSGLLFLLFPFVFCVTNVRVKEFWILLLILLVPISFYEKLYGSYEEQAVIALDTTIDIPELYPIQTSKTRYAFLTKVDSLVKSFQEEEVQVYFYGDKSHIFHYLYPDTDLDLKSFYQPINDLLLLPEIEEKLNVEGRVVLFIVDSYPGDETIEETSLIESELKKFGFRKMTCNSLSYYTK